MNDSLRAYAARTEPAWLTSDDVPVGFDGTPEKWAAIIKQARTYWRLQTAFSFAEGIAVKGFTANELATGAMSRNREVSAISGNVVAKIAPDILDPRLRDRAARALHEANAARAPLNPVGRANVESVARGTYGARDAASQVEAVEREVRAHVAAQRAAEREAKEDQVTIDVPVAFAAIGKRFQAGRSRVIKALADELDEWVERMMAQAHRAGQPDPVAYGVWKTAWPPYRRVKDREPKTETVGVG